MHFTDADLRSLARSAQWVALRRRIEPEIRADDPSLDDATVRKYADRAIAHAVADHFGRVRNVRAELEQRGASLVDWQVLKEHGYRVEKYGDRGWMLLDPDMHNLMIGSHGQVSPTQWEAVAEALSRIEQDKRLADEARAERASVPQASGTSQIVGYPHDEDRCVHCQLDRVNAQRDGNDLVRNADGQWVCPDCETVRD